MDGRVSLEFQFLHLFFRTTSFERVRIPFRDQPASVLKKRFQLTEQFGLVGTGRFM